VSNPTAEALATTGLVIHLEAHERRHRFAEQIDKSSFDAVLSIEARAAA
jgi:hypothetical protein